MTFSLVNIIGILLCAYLIEDVSISTADAQALRPFVMGPINYALDPTQPMSATFASSSNYAQSVSGITFSSAATNGCLCYAVCNHCRPRTASISPGIVALTTQILSVSCNPADNPSSATILGTECDLSSTQTYGFTSQILDIDDATSNLHPPYTIVYEANVDDGTAATEVRAIPAGSNLQIIHNSLATPSDTYSIIGWPTVGTFYAVPTPATIQLGSVNVMYVRDAPWKYWYAPTSGLHQDSNYVFASQVDWKSSDIFTQGNFPTLNVDYNANNADHIAALLAIGYVLGDDSNTGTTAVSEVIHVLPLGARGTGAGVIGFNTTQLHIDSTVAPSAMRLMKYDETSKSFLDTNATISDGLISIEATENGVAASTFVSIAGGIYVVISNSVHNLPVQASPKPNSDGSSSSSSSSALSPYQTALIVGCVAGGIALAALIVAMIVLYVRHHQRKAEYKHVVASGDQLPSPTSLRDVQMHEVLRPASV